MSDVKRQTVSEFIREAKPEWEHIRTREKRTSTGHFSGALQVNTGALGIHDKAGRLIGATIDMDYALPFAEQVEEFDRQNMSGESSTFFEETDVVVGDHCNPDEDGGGSSVPR